MDRELPNAQHSEMRNEWIHHPPLALDFATAAPGLGMVSEPHSESVMNPSYADIKQRAGNPIWYSEGGVPRYADFHPNVCGVYNAYVAFVRIACQACKQEFSVASAVDMMNAALYPVVLPRMADTTDADAWDVIGSFHYGDPPRHDCVGDTMASVPLQILQFWKREIPDDWTRDAAMEFSLPAYTEGSLQL